MKLPINPQGIGCIDLDAPVLRAKPVVIDDVQRYRVCQDWHYHGPAEGHREVHCTVAESPYHRTGYNLARQKM